MRRNAVESLDRSLSILPLIERKHMIDQIRDILFEYEMDALLEEARVPKQLPIAVCPRCGSMSSVNYGYSNNKPRHKCKDCGRTFTERSARSIVFTSKIPKATWMRYIDCFVDELPIATCSQKCSVSIQTAYYMRLRILDLLEQTQDAWRLGSGERAQIDETFTYESFKGNRTKCEDFEMPRPSYVRGRKSDKRHLRTSGKGSDHICIVSGVDERRNTFFEIGARSMLDTQDCQNVLSGKLDEGSCVATDELHAYVGVLNTLKVRHSTHISTEPCAELSRVNALHSHFKAFLARKRGVSTRRLSLYLAEFSWRWQNTINDDPAQTAKRIVQKIALYDCKVVEQDFRNSPYPLMEWWKTNDGKQECERMKIAIKEYNLNKAAVEAGEDPDMQAVVNERREALDQRKREAGIKSIGNETIAKGKGWSAKAPALTTGMLRSKPL